MHDTDDRLAVRHQRWLEALFGSDLKPRARLVAMAVQFQVEEGRPAATVPELAKLVGLTERTVRQYLDQLLDAGWMRVNDAGAYRLTIPHEKRATRPGHVYAIEAGDLVKIGFSSDYKRRVGTLGTMTPIPPTLLGVVPGVMADERALHERFATCRRHGEWFAPDDELRAWLGGLEVPDGS